MAFPGFCPQILFEHQLQSQSYVTTESQPVSLSWNKAHIWDLRPDFYYCLNGAGFLMWGALSDERTSLSFTFAAGPRQFSYCRVRVPRYSWSYFTVSDQDAPNLEGQVPLFTSPSNRVARLYPQALGYGGPFQRKYSCFLCTYRVWNTFSNSIFIV
jgi:hypothetical protein